MRYTLFRFPLFLFFFGAIFLVSVPGYFDRDIIKREGEGEDNTERERQTNKQEKQSTIKETMMYGQKPLLRPSESAKDWLTTVIKIAFIGWLMVWMAMGAFIRVHIFYNKWASVSNQVVLAAVDCISTCKLSNGMSDTVHAGCDAACVLAGSGTSPVMEGIRAAADATYLCGSTPCMKSFGIQLVVAVVGAALGAKFLASYFIAYGLYRRAQNSKKIA